MGMTPPVPLQQFTQVAQFSGAWGWPGVAVTAYAER
jgi:hypothetical protein